MNLTQLQHDMSSLDGTPEVGHHEEVSECVVRGKVVLCCGQDEGDVPGWWAIGMWEIVTLFASKYLIHVMRRIERLLSDLHDLRFQAEILLESYLQDVDEILARYYLTQQQIEAAEGRVTMQLDMARNKLLTTSKDGKDELLADMQIEVAITTTATTTARCCCCCCCC